MSITNFWPAIDQDHAHSCLFTEAETAADAVFLAVHQSMRLSRKAIGDNQTVISKLEHDLLKALLKKDPASGTLIIPIVGNSGVGKSHMIRWLDANLQLRKDSDRRHVVRIPKSSSLKKVLERVLNGLSDDKYGEIKKQMLSAKLPPTRLEATLRLQAGLMFELETMGKHAQNRIAEGNELPGDRDRKAHCSKRGLLALLSDPEIQRHFVAHEGDKVEEWGVLTRIADRCLNGSLKNEKGELNQFLESDFDFLQETSLDTANLSRDTRGYVSSLRLKPERLQQAVQYLKEAREPSVSSLVTFQSSLSLSELFVSIRECLYKEGKELVLLVEDFAVLAGVQGALLDAIVREAVRDGVQELCTMRTAIAVTEGQLPETVLTRSQFVWKIEDTPFASESEAVHVFKNFVGSYLNAARYGHAALELAYENHKDLTSWIPKYEQDQEGHLSEEDQTVMKSFGFAPNGHSLFPLNEGCIRQIAKKYFYSAQDDIYKFDPRKLINKVLRETIIDNRNLYTEGVFPSPDFSEHNAKDLHTDVISVVGEFPLKDQNRVNTLLYFWGDDPRSRDDVLKLPKSIYRAFGLPNLSDSPEQPAPQPVRKPEKRTKTLPESTILEGVDDPQIRDVGNTPPTTWDDRLEDWRKGKTITQQSANAIRGAIEEAVKIWLDSSSLFVGKLVVDKKKIYIPSTAQGIQNSETAMIVACGDDDFKDEKKSARFIMSIRAMMRYEEFRNWDYIGGEFDSSLYTSFISEMSEQAKVWFLSKGAGVSRDAVTPIAQALLIGAGILNIKGGTKKDSLEANLAAILDTGAERTTHDHEAETNWDKLSELAISVRIELIEKLMDLVGCRQGTGGVLAVDAKVLLTAVEDIRRTGWSLPDDIDLTLFGNFTSPVKRYIQKIRTESLASEIESSFSEKKEWLEFVENSLGNDFDRDGVISVFKSTIESAKKASVFRWRGGEPSRLLTRSKEVGSVKETFNLVKVACGDNSDLSTKLSILAKIDKNVISRFTDFLRDYNAFLGESLDVAEVRLDGVSKSPREVAKELDLHFMRMDNIWSVLGGLNIDDVRVESSQENQTSQGGIVNDVLLSESEEKSVSGMTLAKSEQLMSMAERIDRLNSDKEITDALEVVSQSLSGHLDKCESLDRTHKMLHQNSVSAGVLVDKKELKRLKERIQNLRGRLVKEPATLTHRNTWAQCQESIRTLSNSIKTQLENQWKSFVDKESPSTGQTSIFAGLPAHKFDYLELTKLSSDLSDIRNNLPVGPTVVEAVRGHGERMRELIAGMNIEGASAEQVDFLKRCQRGGVPLRELTVSMQDWLDSEGYSQDLVVKVKS